MNRQQAVWSILFCLWIGLLGCDSASRAREDVSSKQVIVVGAGIAGLAAAETLQKRGFQVIVLESRDRIGGRLWTNRDIEGLTLDLGASWIHGISNNPIYGVTRSMSITTQVWDYDDFVLYDSDGIKRAATETRMDTLEELIVGYLNQGRFTDNATVDDAMKIGISEGVFQDYTKTEINYVVAASIENEYAGDATQLAARALEEGGSMRGPEVIFPNGYDQITTLMAQNLDIRLNQRVTRIDYRDARIRINTPSRQYDADYVVVTVPLGVLKAGAIDFDPELPANKRLAIETLGMGVLNKLYLQFPSVFWGGDPANIGFVSPAKGAFSDWLNLTAVTGKPLLMAFTSGQYGKDLESLSDDIIVQRAMNALRIMYGSEIPEPAHAVITRWGNDAHAYGSYSFLSPLSPVTVRKDLAAAIDNKVFFAGEATHAEYPATVHGAYLSGQREANRILSLHH